MAEKQIEVSTTAQAFTTSWVDLGSEANTTGWNVGLLWFDLDINLTNNPRVRVLAKRAASASAEYNLPIYTPGVTDVGVEALYWEWTTDADQKTVLQINLLGMIQSVQVQIQAGTVGGTAGEIESCYLHLK